MASRVELKELMGVDVHLFLQVKVRPKWENEAERFTEMGLDFKDTRG
jgi:GTP-binding protein Era